MHYKIRIVEFRVGSINSLLTVCPNVSDYRTVKTIIAGCESF